MKTVEKALKLNEPFQKVKQAIEKKKADKIKVQKKFTVIRSAYKKYFPFLGFQHSYLIINLIYMLVTL